MAKIIVCMTIPPYQGIQAQDALDFAMGATNYGHDVALVFIGDGVFQLIGPQNSTQGIKNHEKRLKSLPFFDVDELYCCESSLDARSIVRDSLSHDVEVLSSKEIAAVLENAEHVVTF